MWKGRSFTRYNKNIANGNITLKSIELKLAKNKISYTRLNIFISLTKTMKVMVMNFFFFFEKFKKWAFYRYIKKPNLNNYSRYK